MLLDKRITYKPFKYPFAFDAYKKHEKMHWMPDEVVLTDDVMDWEHNLTHGQKEFLTQLFRFFTQQDVSVANAYATKIIPLFSGNPEVAMMILSFAAREGIHVDSYALLIETLGLPESEYSAFLEYAAMRDKYEFLETIKTDSEMDIAKSIAVYSAFTEGMQLYASFAMLMHFERLGKMPGMTNIVRWSMRDEQCFEGHTEVLTTNGWKRLDAVDQTDMVLEYRTDGTVDFVKPYKLINKEFKGDLIRFHNTSRAIDLTCTDDHDIAYMQLTKYGQKFVKQKAKDFTPHYRRQFLTGGFKQTGRNQLTWEERFLIALQADGTLDYRIAEYGKHTGYKTAKFTLQRERKKERLKLILDNLGWEYTINDVKGKEGYIHVKVKGPLTLSKTFDWVKLNEVSHEWAADFLDEVMQWDGSDKYKDGMVNDYSSIVPINVDIIQALAAICGRRATRTLVEEKRSENHSDRHRVVVYHGNQVPTSVCAKDIRPYEGRVYCVSVPSGNIVVRQNDRVYVAGNCHSDNMILLFKEFAREYLNREDLMLLEPQIRHVAEKMVDLEDKFIELAFEVSKGEINTGLPTSQPIMTEHSLKMYIRHIADYRLEQLGFQPIYGRPDNPLKWLDDLMLSSEHANFFETRPTEYSKGTLKGEITEW